MKPNKLFVQCSVLLFLIACNTFEVAPTPSPLPPPPTRVVSISQKLYLTIHSHIETYQDPLFTINSQIPQLAGSDDPHIQALNQIIDNHVQREIELFRDEFLLYSAKPLPSGSSMDATHILTAQYEDIWSFKLNFLYYYDNPKIPVLHSTPVNYDLAQGVELELSDLFLPNSNYLELMSSYCVAELNKRDTTDVSIYGATYPILYNYENWNITPEGLMITFNQTEVASSEAGPQYVIVPYGELNTVIDPQGPLQYFKPAN